MIKLTNLIEEGLGKPGQVIPNPYARAFAPIKEEEVVNEQDHEVSMAQNSLDSIIKNATELKGKIGEMEKNIPGWIQDHITNSENYIEQANSGYHELGESVNEGKKRFNTMYGVGKAKYVVNYHDGSKKHKDGSDFFDIQIFKNQKDFDKFQKALLSKGFIEESVNEGYSTEEKRIVMMAVKKIAKYMNVDIKTAMNYVLGASKELERDIEKGKIK